MNFLELGQAIKTLRTEQHIPQQLMAEHLEISRATLSALENGKAGDIGIKKIIAVLDYLGYELRISQKSPFPSFEELINAKRQA